MKNKIRIPLMFLITIMLAGLVSAVGIFTDPATSDTISGTYRFNINSSLTNTLNCSITGSSALGGDTLTTTWLYNMSHTNESANASIDTTAFNDAIDWTFTGNCYNGTGGGYNTTTVTTVSSVTVNNTLPTCNLTSSQASDNEYLPTASWTVNCSRATGATIAFNGNTYLMTKTSDTCSYSKRIPEGLYKVVVITSDGLDTTSCTTLTGVNIRYDDNAQFASAAAAGTQGMKLAGEATDTAKTKKTNTALVILIVVGLVLWKRKK